MDWHAYRAAIWRPRSQTLRGVTAIDPVRLADLVGIDDQKAKLVANTRRFLEGGPANNALLWGSRGTGKSSLIKALANEYAQDGLRIVQIDRDDLLDLPEIVDEIRHEPRRFLVFCDDLTFEAGEPGYRALKTVLEGSVELPPDNLLVYATSNRRHLMPEPQSDNAQTRIRDGEIHYGDAVEERLSLSDRFGLWLSFYPFDLEHYLAIVDRHFPNHPDRPALHEAARQFALLRGSHSGRTARQFAHSLDQRKA